MVLKGKESILKNKDVIKAQNGIDKAIYKYLQSQKESILKQVDGRLSKSEDDDWIDELDFELDDDSIKSFIDKVSSFFIAIGAVAYSYALKSLNIENKVVEDESKSYNLEYAQNRSAELIGKRINKDGSIINNPNAKYAITETTREDIKSLIRGAIKNGNSNADLAEALNNNFLFSKERSMMIARTETNIADNDITMNSYKNAGVEKKSWLTAQDDLVSDECRENEEEGAIGMNEEFSSGDSCPPCHPNCRCTLLAVFDFDED